MFIAVCVAVWLGLSTALQLADRLTTGRMPTYPRSLLSSALVCSAAVFVLLIGQPLFTGLVPYSGPFGLIVLMATAGMGVFAAITGLIRLVLHPGDQPPVARAHSALTTLVWLVIATGFGVFGAGVWFGVSWLTG